MRMRRSPFFTFRPSLFHAYSPATRWVGSLPCDLEDVAEAVVVKPVHNGQIDREAFGVSCLKLRD